MKKSFEEELNELENIVKSLENGDINLDDAVKEYTKAMELAKSCSDKLKNAEETVNKIRMNDGSLADFSIEEN